MLIETKERAFKVITRARYLVQKTLPYLTSTLGGVSVVVTDKVDTAVMVDTGVMFVNCDFISGLDVGMAAWVITHEFMHWIDQHGPRAKALGIETKDERFLWNIAGDITINYKLSHVGGLSQWPGAVRADLFGLPEGKTVEQYYGELAQGGKQDKLDEAAQEPMQGACGSAAGNPQPGEDEALAELTEQLAAEGLAAPCYTERQVEAMKKQLAEEIVKREKSHGDVPGGFHTWANDYLTSPKKSWQTLLREELAHASTWTEGDEDNTYSVRSPHQAAFGYGPGSPILIGAHSPQPEVLFALDTSGSMGREETKVLMAEAAGVIQASGHQVSFMAADAAVHSTARVSSVEEVLKHIKGGGGTDFRPVFNAAEKMNPRPNVIVYGTDGYGTCPPSAPRWCRVIWLVTVGGRTQPWGRNIKLG